MKVFIKQVYSKNIILLKEEFILENLEEIFKNKKTIMIISIIVILIIGGILILNSKEKNEETVEILEKIEQGMEDGNKQDLIQNSQTNIEVNQELNEKIENEEIEQIAIHITGEVKKKGILYIEKGARIADAIKVAGGTTKNADLSQVNLAYILEDGQKIYIPNKKEKIKQEMYIEENSGQNVLIEESKNSEEKASTKKENSMKGVKKKVNINSANQTELETLKGIGPSLAGRIIEYRETNGKFDKIEEIQNVKGIGDSKYSNIKDSICI